MATEQGTFSADVPISTAPRFIAVINDVEWNDLIAVDVELASFNITGTFEIYAILSRSGDADPGQPIQSDSRLDILLKPHVQPRHDIVAIYGGYPNDPDRPNLNELTLLLTGVIDRIYLDWTRDTVRIVGRDRSAVFADSFVHKQFRNQSVAGVIKELADKHELKSQITDSGTSVGTVYTEESISTETNPYQGQSEWDILAEFAAFDGYAVFVVGDTLYYQPIEESTKVLEFVHGVDPQIAAGNIDDLEAEKNFGASAGRIGVEILSAKVHDKEAILGRAGAVRGGDAIVYTFVRPNLDADTAQALADALIVVYAQFELLVRIHTTGAPQQDLFSCADLFGTGSIFDTRYRIMRIQWSWGGEPGWRAVIECVRFPEGGDVRVARKGQNRRLGVSK